MNSMNTPARRYAPGIGDAVADRTINRKLHPDTGEELEPLPFGIKDDRPFVRETWEQVALRVAIGNSNLAATPEDTAWEFEPLHHHLRQASILMSGRHLQHGDAQQHTRNQEVFTNCGRFDTEVMTLEKGVVKIGEVAGETLTIRTADGEWRPATFYAHGEQKLYKLTFVGVGNRSERVVHFTRDHRWLLKSGEFTSEIKVGDILMAAPTHKARDAEGVIHGLIFGDGSAHKGRRDGGRPGVSQGRTYATLRVCKQDAVRDEIHQILDVAGYSYTTPPHANGDRVYYIGKFEFAKELPFTRDPDYIAGFIYGWWLADGNKTEASGTLAISTADKLASDWLQEHAVIAGLTVLSAKVKQRRSGDGSYPNGKPLNIIRLREGVQWQLRQIEEAETEVVYCPEEPITSSFVLANGVLTGNCSTAAATFLEFYLLLNGSGVGRAYDDAMIVADLAQQPIVVPVIDMSHADSQSGEINALDARSAKHLYAGRKITTFEVPDSREGWAKAIEQIETMAFERRRNEVLIIDFSKVRPRGSPIRGMQNRPASGPGPLIAAIKNIAQLRDAGMAPWRSAMYADHYAAECVLVGGARRAARMATKFWKDLSVLDFIAVKRGGFLWSSNNSVTVDKSFWAGVRKVEECIDTISSGDPFLVQDLLMKLVADNVLTALDLHAHRVYSAICDASYHDGTGEPGIINVDELTWKDEDIDVLSDGDFAESARYKLDAPAKTLMKALFDAWKSSEFKVITNPCGEIVLSALGGYCVIADVVPFHSEPKLEPHYRSTDQWHSDWDADAEDAFRTATRALIRVNQMDCLYGKEVKRTNRIGVGMTGLHEYAWARFGFGWHDIVDEQKSLEFWQTLSRFSRAVVEEARTYSKVLGVKMPHTALTMKPAGTTSKLFGLTEGAHLPSMREYLRWVQFRNDDPLVAEYEAKGYPVRKLRSYAGTTIVGFPTAPTICHLGMGDKLVTAAEATPEEQYQFLRLMEKYWLHGYQEQDLGPATMYGKPGRLVKFDKHDYANQVSYTLKLDTKIVSFERFKKTLLEGQSTVKCCSVMPIGDLGVYEYTPEQPVSKHEYEIVTAAIRERIREDVGVEHVDCTTGACPISFGENG